MDHVLKMDYLAFLTISSKCDAGLSKRNFNVDVPTVLFIVQTILPSKQWLVNECKNVVTL